MRSGRRAWRRRYGVTGAARTSPPVTRHRPTKLLRPGHPAAVALAPGHGTIEHGSPVRAGGGTIAVERAGARRAGQGPRLLGAGLAPLQARPRRDRRRRLHHRAHPRRFVGAPIAARRSGTGRTTSTVRRHSTATRCDPVGPWVDVSSRAVPRGRKAISDGATSSARDGKLGRDMFLRLLYGAQTSLEVALLATFFSVLIGIDHRLARRLLPRRDRHRRLAPDRDHDGVPGPALHDRGRRDGRRPAEQGHVRRLLAPGRLHAGR